MRLIWNDGARRARPERRALIEARAGAAGHELEVRETRAAGDAERFAAEACSEAVELLLVHGGDGTINEVVNGLAGASSSAPRLGILAGGTANDFVRGMALPLDLEAALAVAFEGAEACIDIGRVNGRCFANVSTGGFGATAVRGAGGGLKRVLGPFAYLYGGARRLLEFEPYRGVFRADGREVFAGRFALFAVGNSWRTGGGTRVTPRAAVADGRLDIAVIGVSSRYDLLTLLPDLRAGSHIAAPNVRYLRARRLEVDPERPVPVNADGEPLSADRFVYDVLTRRLRLMIPRPQP